MLMADEAHVRRRAAIDIQRVYRGHRERRQLKGHGLTSSQRWDEAIAEARYRKLNAPISRAERELRSASNSRPSTSNSSGSNSKHGAVSTSKDLWNRAVGAAMQAQHDDPSSGSDESEEEGDTEERLRKREERRRAKKEKRKERIEYAKALDMQYFLEMVDLKHRYGSNLRFYHDMWKNLETHENFFYWLDHGEGKNIDHPMVSRERLERERVRYLSREERLAYLVEIDKDGRLCWVKNGQRIDTTDQYKDSPQGIVPIEAEPSTSTRPPPSPTTSQFSVDSTEAKRYTHPHTTKLFHSVSPSTILNHLLSKTTKKNTWIFVADTSFRLYVGLKISGAFQHSSFLHGGRVSAAGLIRIKDGKLKSLAPLSGHYRPPASTFRKFMKSLKEAGVDMSGLTVSKSYAVLVGLEAFGKYKRGKKKTKATEEKVKGKVEEQKEGASVGLKERTLEGRRKKEQLNAEKEGSKREKREDKGKRKEDKENLKREDKEREENSMALKIMKRLSIKPREPKTGAAVVRVNGVAEEKDV